MSFLGGAECSTAGNPLSQFTKHVQDDTSLQRDRLVGRTPNGSVTGFRSAGRSTPQDEAVHAFLHQSPNLPDMALEQQHPTGHVHMDPVSQGVHLRAHSTSPTWAGDFQKNQAAMEAAYNIPAGTQFSTEEFARFSHVASASSSSARSSPLPGAAAAAAAAQQQQQRPMMGVGMMAMGMNYGMMSRPTYQPMSMCQPQPHLQQVSEGKGKGKEKVVELDDNAWEEQFAQMELQDSRVQDENMALEPELDEMDEKLLHSETGFGDLESIWKGIQAEKAEWQNLDEVEQTLGKFDDNFGEWDTLNGRVGGRPVVEDYLFEEDNLFTDQMNPFDEGVRIMSEGGNLSLAALAFEAAVRQNPDHIDAWVHLGTAQAQNEKEEAAIRAMEHALKLDPNNLAALMGLAVSYTNEGYDSTAYRTLERWLSVKYANIVAPQDVSSAAELGFTDRIKLHDKVTNEFIDAARLSPDGEHMDPDVQVGLGVLFYGAEEYEKAVDCFESALRSSELGTSNQRDQRHLLYNRLGATLANSGRSEEAIQAYEKALEIRPNFVRARYNLGVSCINIGCPAQAADHLLTALDMHKSVEKSGRERAREILGGKDVTDAHIDAMVQNRSTTLYDTLRRVFTQMGRRDLAEKVTVGVDPDIFRGEFDF